MKHGPAKPISPWLAGIWRGIDQGRAMSGRAERHEHFLRLSFAVARRSLTHGDQPFGCIVVDAEGKVLIEAEDGYMPNHDGTALAERLRATEGWCILVRGGLATGTLDS